MLLHKRIGTLRVAAIQRVDDGAMLAHRAFRGVRPAVEREDQAGAGRYFSHVARQQRIARHVRQQDVKLARQPDRQWLVGAARGLFFLDVAAQPGRLLGRELSGECRDDEALQPEADGEDIARFVPAGLGDRSAVVAPKLHQPFAGEPAQRMPHQRAADPEAFADGVLGQLGAGLQRLLDDGASQRLIDGAGAISHRYWPFVSSCRCAGLHESARCCLPSRGEP